jgi:hypothetical protein
MAVVAQPSDPVRISTVELEGDRALEVISTGEATVLRVRSSKPAERLELELRFTAEGPVVRTRAAALELEAAEAITARCERFAVEARGDVTLHAGGELRLRSEQAASIAARNVAVEASPGAVRLRANDDVQLLGELVLLNCDRIPPMPSWVPPQRHQPVSLPPNAISGDPSVVAELLATPHTDPEDR